jgi:hypothetical protein
MTGINIGGSAVVDVSYVPYEKDLDQLWYVPMGGGTPVLVIDKASGIRVASPVAAPDYSQIAYIYHNGGNESLRIIDRDGANDTQLLPNTNRVLFPDWNPDGGDLIFTSYASGDEDKIQKINPDGTGLTTIYTHSTGGQLYRACYNRDGSKIAFYREQGGSPFAVTVWVCDADGSNPVQVSSSVEDSQVIENAISWMHNSDVIAFGDGGTFTNGDAKYYRVDADGSNQAQIAQSDSTGSDRGMCPRRAWTADDSTFLFQKFDNPGGHYTAWSAPAAGGSDTQLTPGFGIARLPPLVFGSRVYADGEDVPTTMILGLISALPDGSDQRVDDGPDGVRLEFPN